MKRIVFALLGVILSLGTAAQSARDSLYIASYHWKVDTVADGLVMKRGHFMYLYGQPQNIVIFEADSAKRDIGLKVNFPVQLTTTSAADTAALAAVNGSFFNMKHGNSVCYVRQNGVVSDTTAFNPIYNAALIISDDGNISFTPWDKDKERTYDSTRGSVLVSGPMLLCDYAYSDLPKNNPGFVEARHPRTAMAIMPDGRSLLITVDGRQKDFAGGMSLQQLAHFLKIYGAEHALNLDGGGSTTAWSSSMPGSAPVNSVSGSTERKVANIIFVY